MRLFLIFLICILRSATHLHAGEKTTEGCTSPDFRHEVILQGDDDATDYDLIIRETSSHPAILLSKLTGGWGTFAAATTPINFKCLWSPDSTLVAVCQRETKRSAGTSLFSVGKRITQEIAVPDLTPKIAPQLTAEIRGYWVRPEVWLPDHRLILSVEGTQKDEEKGNFRFLVTLQIIAGDADKLAARIVSCEQDRSVSFSAR